METRRASIELVYKSKKITEHIEPDLLGFTYVDNASGAADDVSIRLKDKSGKWMDNWAPATKDLIKPTIVATNWKSDGSIQKLACGTFLVDDIGYSGRPQVMDLGAVSTPSNTNFMTVDKSRTWKEATIKKIAQTIADAAGVSLYFDSATNPAIKYIEQSETPDVSFLFDLCAKYGLAMKVYNQKIVIFSEAAYEAKSSKMTITENMLESGWSAKNTLTDSGYDGCKIAYMSHKDGRTLKYTYKAGTGNKIYSTNETADSLADAQLLAKNKLRELNKQQYTMSFSIAGELTLRASNVVKMSDFGIFDGNYYIDKVTRTIGGEFTASFEVHKVLKGY
jgi:phage protein D